MNIRLLWGFGALYVLTVNATETTTVFTEGDQTFSDDVLAGSFACANDDCVPSADQKLYTVSARDLVDESGALGDMPPEVTEALLQDVYGSRMIAAIANDVAPGGRFATHYAQVAVSKAEVADLDAGTVSCSMVYPGYSSGSTTFYPTNMLGRHASCHPDETLLDTHLSFRCDGAVFQADRSCHKVSRNGFDVPVAPFTDIATTRATASDEVAPPYLFGPRSRTSLFTEATLKREYDDGTLYRPSDANRAAWCMPMHRMGDSFNWIPNSNGMANCFAYHQCDPDPQTAADFTFPSFQDTCFPPFTTMFSNNYDSNGDPLTGAAVHSIGPEAGTPPPGLWNVNGSGYESVLLQTFPCDPDDGISQNVLFAVADDGTALCLFDPDEKAAGTATIHIADNPDDLTMPPTAPLQKVMFYSPIHRFVKEGDTWYEYTIRPTMLMYWGLLVGDIYGTANPAPDIAFTPAEDFHINLAYYWDETAGPSGGYVHPGCQAGRLEGEPCAFDIGMVMNTRYNSIVFPCMDDGSGNCDAWNGGTTYGHIDAISLHGTMNLEYSTSRFVTRISVSQLTTGGSISASTFVSGAALDMAVTSKTCHKYSSSDADVVFHMTMAGLEEQFTISTNYVEYYHEDAGVVHRVVFENHEPSCGISPRAHSIPAGPCYNAVSSPTASGNDAESVAVSVRLPLDKCRDDFGQSYGPCVDKLQGWLADSASSTGARKIFIGYTMSFGASASNQGFVQRQQLDCSSGICDALLRPDAVAALEQCESTTAVGGEVTISQVTNLVTKTLAVAVQPTFSEIDARPPCKVLASGKVVCPALLHDQCEAGKGVASVQHLIAACGGVYSGANIRTSSALASGAPAGAADPTCTHSNSGDVRTVFTDNCRDHDSNEAECNVRYQPHVGGSDAFRTQCKMNDNGFWCQAVNGCTLDSGSRRLQDLPSICVDDADGSENSYLVESCSEKNNQLDICLQAYEADEEGGGIPCIDGGRGFCIASTQQTCTIGSETVETTDTTTTPVTESTPIKVLGNGLGYLHLGAAAGPQVQPVTRMQQARQLVFPIGATLTATCTDTDATAFERHVIGGVDTAGNWLVTTYEWEHILGMDPSHYAPMKAAVENKAQLVDAALVVADQTQILTRTNGVAVDSAAMFNKAQSHACHVNDVKPFTFLGSDRADDHCDWVASGGGSTNPYSDACAGHINGGLDVQGLVAKGTTNAVVHGKPDTTACNSGPAMVLGFNDQSPQYLADSSLTSEAVEVTAHWPGANRHKGAQPHSPTSCPDADVDATCDETNGGYRGWALAPMHAVVNDGGQSFYTEFKGADTDDGQYRVSVMSAFGVDINTAYLSQCGSGPTEWKLDTQFFHVDGVTPINGMFRRALEASTTVGALSSSSVHVDGEEDTAPRALQDSDGAPALASTVSAVVQGTALSCMDGVSVSQGVFDTACLCDDTGVLQSGQCQMNFAPSEPPPQPPPPPPPEDTSSSFPVWILLIVALGASVFAYNKTNEHRRAMRAIAQDYTRKLLTDEA